MDYEEFLITVSGFVLVVLWSVDKFGCVKYYSERCSKFLDKALEIQKNVKVQSLNFSLSQIAKAKFKTIV